MTTPTFSFGYDFVMGLGKAHLPDNLEVTTFSRYKNIKGELQNFGDLPWSMATLIFWCDFMMALGKPKLHTKFEVVGFSRCRNIKRGLQNFGKLPQPRTTPTFLLRGIL